MYDYNWSWKFERVDYNDHSELFHWIDPSHIRFYVYYDLLVFSPPYNLTIKKIVSNDEHQLNVGCCYIAKLIYMKIFVI